MLAKLNKLHKAPIAFLVILTGLSLRLLFLLTKGYLFDINLFLTWGSKIADSGLWSLYAQGYHKSLDYPPLVPLFTAFMLRTNYWNLDPALLFKLWLTAIELILTGLSVWHIKRSGYKYANLLSIFIFLQPSLYFISSGWGQVDALLSLIILLAYLVSEKHTGLATFLIFLSLLVKPQALIAIAIFGLYLFAKRGWKVFAIQLIILALLVSVVEIAFQFHHTSFLITYTMAAGRYPFLSVNAFGLWHLLYGSNSLNISDGTGLISHKFTGLILFLTMLVPALVYLFTKAKTIPQALLVNAYAYLIFFCFLTQIHERYLFPAIALFGIAAVLDKKVFFIYAVLSASFFINCSSVIAQVYPLENHLRKDSMILFSSYSQFLAGLNVAAAVYFAFYFISHLTGLKNQNNLKVDEHFSNLRLKS